MYNIKEPQKVILDKISGKYIYACKCCFFKVSKSDNYCSVCGTELEWVEKDE